jgi:hypothetical protein
MMIPGVDHGKVTGVLPAAPGWSAYYRVTRDGQLDVELAIVPIYCWVVTEGEDGAAVIDPYVMTSLGRGMSARVFRGEEIVLEFLAVVGPGQDAEHIVGATLAARAQPSGN